MTATLSPFSQIFDRAAQRKGGEEALLALSAVELKSPQALAKLDDSRYLSAMTQAVFKAGFVWRVIDKKWPDFEKAFWQFNILRCAMISPDDIHTLSQNTGIVRNVQKITTVPINAAMIMAAAEEHGSFAHMIAHWRDDDFAGLLIYLSKHGSRLGGNSCQYFLRVLGKDSFILSKDGITALLEAGAISVQPKSPKALRAVQSAYNQWRQESGMSNAQISRILAMSTGSNDEE